MINCFGIACNMICKSNSYRRFVLICAFTAGALSCSTPGQTERSREATPRETNSSVRDVSTPGQDTMREYRNTSRVHSFETFENGSAWLTTDSDFRYPELFATS